MDVPNFIPNLWVSQISSNSWVSQISSPPKFHPPIHGCPKFHHQYKTLAVSRHDLGSITGKDIRINEVILRRIPLPQRQQFPEFLWVGGR